MKLVVAEKPSVAMALAKVVGARERKDDMWRERSIWCRGALGI